MQEQRTAVQLCPDEGARNLADRLKWEPPWRWGTEVTFPPPQAHGKLRNMPRQEAKPLRVGHLCEKGNCPQLGRQEWFGEELTSYGAGLGRSFHGTSGAAVPFVAPTTSGTCCQPPLGQHLTEVGHHLRVDALPPAPACFYPFLSLLPPVSVPEALQVSTRVWKCIQVIPGRNGAAVNPRLWLEPR